MADVHQERVKRGCFCEKVVMGNYLLQKILSLYYLTKNELQRGGL
ncbi:hypothetical protein B4088_0617 [Bacillus cereus]|uniref:Uncharacterized protein n=1 Tax=Bacillus cereus TaxID=1396 RepID=A0A164QTA2_BACCE|nr:hypothetical protein B4088_0617 [Bacillus cereus]